MTPQEKLNKIQEQNKARAKRYYEAHKAEVAERRKTQREECKEAMAMMKQEEKKEEKQPAPQLAMIKQRKDNFLKNDVLKEIGELNWGKTDVNNVKQLIDILDIEDFYKSLKAYKRVYYKIETATLKHDSSKLYGVNSKKSMYQTILKLNDKLEMKLPKNAVQFYKDKHEEMKLDSSELTKQKVEEEKVEDFKSYLDKVKEHFGEVSKEYIIASLYHLSGFRDNLQLVLIEKETKETKKKTDVNYLVIPVDGKSNLHIILNRYKTDKLYETDDIVVPKKLSKLIRRYCIDNKIGYDEYLFGDKSLVKFIKKFNKELGYDITINKLRQMRVSSKLTDATTSKEKVKLAKEMKHKPMTSEKYKRKVKVVVI